MGAGAALPLRRRLFPCHADFVILQAADRIEALRLKPARLFVVRRGKVVAETAPVASRVRLEDREVEVTFSSG